MNIQKLNKKLDILEIVIIFLFLLLAYFLFKTIYLKEDFYKEKLNSLTNVIVYGESAPRGRIYDRNYNLLVDNIAVPIIYYKKVDKITKQEEIELIYEVIDKLELEYDKLKTRNLKEFYLVLYPNKGNEKITEEEWDKQKQRVLNSSDIENLKIARITDDELNTLSETDRKAAYLYYLMNQGYSYSEKIIKSSNVTDSEYAYFSENNYKLKGFDTKVNWERNYLYQDTLKKILGSVGSIPKEEKESYLKKGYELTDIVGLSNIEKQYEDILKGTKAKYKKVASNKLVLLEDAKRGNDIVLSIDINLQKEVDSIIDRELIRAKGEANTKYLSKTYAIIQQPSTGEVLAISGREVIKQNQEYITYDITPYSLTDPMTPGSVIKGASMLVGYNTGTIQIGEYTTDECIKIKNLPAKCSSHRVGRLNDIIALAESSNVYQFKIAMKVGGATYSYNEPLTINPVAFDIYRNTFKEFGLGVKTEIDLPVESLGYSGTKTAPDLLLNFSIGQYDSYTPIQLSQYITTIASNGKRLKPHLLKEIHEATSYEELGKTLEIKEPVILNTVSTKEEYLKRVQEGFVAVMEVGLGKKVMGNSPNPAGKTGTSESFIDTDKDGKIDTETTSNAFVGYAPSDNPTMTITVTSPDVEDPNTGYNYRTYMNRRIVRMISNKYFEMFPIKNN
ncbi:penicillin-binding protein 2 [bacterium]|nr:penicillin-binding protein 2 [bacterium]